MPLLREDVKVESSTVFRIVFIATIFVLSFYYSTEPNTVFSQSDDSNEDKESKDDISNNDQDATTPAATKEDESENNKSGSTNPSIINTVSKYYPIARTADAPLMFLDCRGRNNDNENAEDDISSTINSSTTQTDCKEYSDDGRLNLVNRYTIRGWAHDSERAANLFSDEYMLHRFKEIVDSQTKYNVDDKIKSIPIIIWHNIANNVEDDPYTTTSIELFEAEIKYLHDNGFTVLTMSDLLYDKNSNSLKINLG
jgi:hypothetical protein